jgi:hypothetical protein
MPGSGKGLTPRNLSPNELTFTHKYIGVRGCDFSPSPSFFGVEGWGEVGVSRRSHPSPLPSPLAGERELYCIHSRLFSPVSFVGNALPNGGEAINMTLPYYPH